MRFAKLPVVMAFTATTLVGFLAGQAYATKPTVSNDIAAKKANIIAVANIVASTEVRKEAKDPNGNWTPDLQRVRARLSRVIKCDLGQEIDFDVSRLGFDKDKDYVLFLQASSQEVEDQFGKKKVLALNYVDAPSRRVEATEQEIQAVKDLIGQGPARKEPN